MQKVTSRSKINPGHLVSPINSVDIHQIFSFGMQRKEDKSNLTFTTPWVISDNSIDDSFLIFPRQ